MNDNNKNTTTIEVEDGTVVICLTPYSDDGFKASLKHITAKRISDDEEQLFLNVIGRGLVSLAFNDTERVLEEGQSVLAEQMQQFNNLDELFDSRILTDLNDGTEEVAPRFDDPKIVDLMSIQPKGRA